MPEATDKVPPLPYYPSRRLLGLEIELDALYAPFHDPGATPGWSSKPDGSLHNGREYILEPPLPVVEAKDAVEAFSASATKAKMHVAMRGGFHIHVQIHDYTLDDATRLAQLYHHYQPFIDLLCAPSRRSRPTPNRYAMPYAEMPTKQQLTEVFHLTTPAHNRVEAKRTRQQMVLNFAMMRCTDPIDRTVEFRQPSPSKHTINIYGWACLAAALTEIARKPPVAIRYIKARPSWRNFLALCRRMEIDFGGRNLAAWAVWRRDYLQQLPTGDKLQKLYHSLIGRSHGLFHIARKLDINLAVAKRLVEMEVHKRHIIEERPNRWRVEYESVAPLDLRSVLAVWEAAENPAGVTATVCRAVPPTRVL